MKNPSQLRVFVIALGTCIILFGTAQIVHGVAGDSGNLIYISILGACAGVCVSGWTVYKTAGRQNAMRKRQEIEEGISQIKAIIDQGNGDETDSDINMERDHVLREWLDEDVDKHSRVSIVNDSSHKRALGSRKRAKSASFRLLGCFSYLCFTKESKSIIDLTVADLRRDRKEMVTKRIPMWVIRLTMFWRTAGVMLAILRDAILRILGKVLPVARLINSLRKLP